MKVNYLKLYSVAVDNNDNNSMIKGCKLCYSVTLILVG